MQSPHSPTRTILQVSELNAEVALLLQSAFPLLWIEGEISNLSRPASGHLYFSLKDDKAQVRCAMFKNRSQHLGVKPENGKKVLARARIGLYEARGDYQLIIEHMEDAGEGKLEKAFQELKKTLNAEGLFAESGKKPLPVYPQRIGIITSPTGAAIQDILNVLQRRCPQIPVLIYPVAVQGSHAGPEIIKALCRAEIDNKCDVLLLARGGGSIEDLWAFNEEPVARAIHACKIPVVTGVGHEIDFTIADFISDQRAPTPSAAAELISPDNVALGNQLGGLRGRLIKQIEYALQSKRERFRTLEQRLLMQKADRKIQQHVQRVDELEIRLKQAMQNRLSRQRLQLQHHISQLLNTSPLRVLEKQRNRLQESRQRLIQHIDHQLQIKQTQLARTSAQLDVLSPLQTLKRGYAIVSHHEHIVRSIQQVKPGDKLRILVADGAIESITEGNSTSS